MKKVQREELNLLLLRQRYLKIKLHQGQHFQLKELKQVHLLIDQWYAREGEKVQHQSRVKEFQSSERSSIYHHELHKRRIKKSSILRLQTRNGVVEGHDSCASFLEQSVQDLLLHPAQLDPRAQEVLLNEVVPVFTREDNEMMLTPPTNHEVLKTVEASNLHAAPGTDGLPSLLYKECWPILGSSLSDVMRSVFAGQKLPRSMNTSLMVFGAKPKKPNSILPGDKRKISLLNSDFKTATGLEARLLKKTATHSLSPLQLVAGSDRRIHHGINMARNAIFRAGKPGQAGCGILDTDLVAAFDFLCMDWVFRVLEKKGMDLEVIKRLKNLYSHSLTIVVVNNIPGKIVPNIRQSLRQGDLPSMVFFSFGIDPLLVFLEKRLAGILISSLPLLGPVNAEGDSVGNIEERYKVFGYADDVKPAITNMQEFSLVDKAMSLFEKASGCRLHRDPANKKCKFLPLARWRGTLQQEDIPCPYMTISDHLEMLGVELRATWTQTRKANGDISQGRIGNTIKQWKAGKFMHFSLRSWSINQYCLPKMWFRTHSVDLRVQDVTKVTSLIKSWLYQDQLLKPEELVMHRPTSLGGLGVHCVMLKAQAGLIRSFLETAINPSFRQSLFHNILFRYHVLGDSSIPDPGYPPFYSEDFFSKIKRVHQHSPLNVATMTEKQWYRLLLEDYSLMEDNNEVREYKKCRVEQAKPETNWERSWRLARLSGLGPENTSFLFKMLHQLLPTQERLARLSPNTSSSCILPGCVNLLDDLPHALVQCQGNDGVGLKVMECVRSYAPNLDVEAALRLELDVSEEAELPLVWLLSTVCQAIWKCRATRTKVNLYDIRSKLEAQINLLRETRFSNITIILDQLVINYFS